ncbi:N-acetyltransferase B complex non catalytic subunit-domain-containing protein [Dendryphion nanum]|uniref:N-acetyltransferase B complex non catalytic subunit-domain-containing protein n=1 Tax=Dendryphion nanum TaxID=256645 RepID=A0A9P9E7M7_9PLEO|nr:N-acetyltransferase B complex non catalytic subunit-domain-containing protein [Dendryphion nanum]
MSLDWDKLIKLQRDYAGKSKLALAEATRRLKKKPHDPFLLTWRAELALQLGDLNGNQAGEILRPLLKRQPPILDLQLLSYIYIIQVGITERSNFKAHKQHSAGEEVVGAWKNAAKALTSRKARTDLWSELFVVSMRAGCWSDVHEAIVQAQLEGGLPKKQLVFTDILAMQMSHDVQKEVATRLEEPLDKKADITGKLALAKLKVAFNNAKKSPQDPVQIQELRDVQFMAQIFARHGQLKELFELWDTAAPTLKTILDKNHGDIVLLKAKLLQQQSMWADLATHCVKSIEEATNNSTSQTPFIDLMERSWKLWGALMVAAKQAPGLKVDDETINHRIQRMIKEDFESTSVPKSRAADLTRLAMTSFVEASLLPLLQSYWIDYRFLNGCFRDLLPFVEQLNVTEQSQFQEYIASNTKDEKLGSNGESTKSGKDSLQAEVNVLRFQYLLNISIPTELEAQVVEPFVKSAIDLYTAAKKEQVDCRFDAGCLAIMGLLVLHTIVGSTAVDDQSNNVTKDSTPELGTTRYLLQAAVLAKKLTASEDGRNHRPLVLLSARLYITLGLGTLANDQYKHAKVKEMLHDTVSYPLLSRISHIHPFDTLGQKQFYPGERLGEVIGAINRMESKTGQLIYRDLKSFQSDQAVDVIECEKKFKSSLTKHFCVIERRRIARLKGEALDGSTELPLSTFINITDNRDFNALPSYETTSEDVHTLLSPHSDPGAYPNGANLYNWHAIQETTLQKLQGDLPSKIHDQSLAVAELAVTFPPSTTTPNLTLADRATHPIWRQIKLITDALFDNKASTPAELTSLTTSLDTLLSLLQTTHSTLATLLTSIQSTTLLFPHEKALTYYFAHLELHLTLTKLLDFISDHRKKTPLLRNKIKEKSVADIKTVSKNIAGVIQDLAKKGVQGLKSDGRKVVKGLVCEGFTGELLREVLGGEEEVEWWVDEIVESGVEALEGVGRVKVGK